MLNGTVIKDQWRLLSKIGEGEIYMTKNILTNEIAAIKLERVEAKKQVLKLEVAVLKKLQSCTHVCRLIACGRHLEWNYMVMELLGENLSELRRNAGGRFDFFTTLQLGRSFVSILEEIHRLGYIHRDIKPSNFAIGLQGENRRKIYLIDWGLARRFISADGSVRPQRDCTGFRGTARYASINSHNGKDLSRRDDLWSVFYIMVEFAKGSLPWRRIKEKEKIGEMKSELNTPDLVRGLPPVFTSFMDYLQSLNYEDKPDYNYIKSILTEGVDRIGGSRGFPWETTSSNSRISMLPNQASNVALMSSEDSHEAGSGVSSVGPPDAGAGGRSSTSHSKPDSTSSGAGAANAGVGAVGIVGNPPNSPQQKYILVRGKGDVGNVSIVKPSKTLIGTPYLSRTSNTTLPSLASSSIVSPVPINRVFPDDRESIELEFSLQEEEIRRNLKPIIGNSEDSLQKRKSERNIEKSAQEEEISGKQDGENEGEEHVVIDSETTTQNKESSECDVEGTRKKVRNAARGKKKKKNKSVTSTDTTSTSTPQLCFCECHCTSCFTCTLM